MTAVYRSDNFHRANGIPTRIPSVVRFPMHKHSTRFSPVNLTAINDLAIRGLPAWTQRKSAKPFVDGRLPVQYAASKPNQPLRQPEFKLGRIYLTIKIRTIPKP